MQRHGWTLLFHDGITNQLHNLQQTIHRIKRKRPGILETNANYKLYAAISHIVLNVIPEDPNNDRFRQGNTMGTNYRHWRRAKIGSTSDIPEAGGRLTILYIKALPAIYRQNHDRGVKKVYVTTHDHDIPTHEIPYLYGNYTVYTRQDPFEKG